MPGVCPRCNREVYFAEEKLAVGRVWHSFCFSCRNCRKLLDSCTVSTHEDELYCKYCCSRLFPPTRSPLTTRPGERQREREREENSSRLFLVASGASSSDSTETCGDAAFAFAGGSGRSRLRGGGGGGFGSVRREDSWRTSIDSVSSETVAPTLGKPAVGRCEVDSPARETELPQRRRRVQLRRGTPGSDGLNCVHFDLSTGMRETSETLEHRQGPGQPYDIWQASAERASSPGYREDEEEACASAYESAQDSLEDSAGREDKRIPAEEAGEPSREADFPEEDRLRGGCGGCGGCCRMDCCQGCATRSSCSRCGRPGSCRSRVEICPVEDPIARSAPCSRRRGCCSPVAASRKLPTCVAEKNHGGSGNGCGGGGCCGSGCRGGCGRPGQICMPSRPCALPPCGPQRSAGGSPCSLPSPCHARSPCGKATSVAGKTVPCPLRKNAACHRPRSGSSSRCRQKIPVGCDCLGGGLDCQRCGRKVYQAEMQIASGVPYHNICFSCFCCRKPLEPLTYQENCGEIYCKQCYIRNFGPQGYGYGAGAGALQTPM